MKDIYLVKGNDQNSSVTISDIVNDIVYDNNINSFIKKCDSEGIKFYPENIYKIILNKKKRQK